MLELLTRLKRVLPDSHLRFLPDSMAPAKGGQGGIRERHSTGDEFLMDPDEIALAVDPQFQDLLPIGFGFLGSDQQRHLRRLRPQDFAYG